MTVYALASWVRRAALKMMVLEGDILCLFYEMNVGLKVNSESDKVNVVGESLQNSCVRSRNIYIHRAIAQMCAGSQNVFLHSHVVSPSSTSKSHLPLLIKASIPSRITAWLLIILPSLPTKRRTSLSKDNVAESWRVYGTKVGSCCSPCGLIPCGHWMTTKVQTTSFRIDKFENCFVSNLSRREVVALCGYSEMTGNLAMKINPSLSRLGQANSHVSRDGARAPSWIALLSWYIMPGVLWKGLFYLGDQLGGEPTALSLSTQKWLLQMSCFCTPNKELVVFDSSLTR